MVLHYIIVTNLLDQVVERLRKPYPYYHRRYNRVPTIEQCRTDDFVCFYEANEQYQRDRAVDRNILKILRRRHEECAAWYHHELEDVERFCKDIMAEHEEAAVNFFIKYGDLAWNTTVIDVFMKQKHRMLWERRNGPVGSGVRHSAEAARAAEAADKLARKEDNMLEKLRRHFGSIGLPKDSVRFFAFSTRVSRALSNSAKHVV
ncbi:unnamed protein product [Dicrocoelium dendriticum]|nr:unnamed protein product [Dicrocoelium dendriticum]